MNARPFALAAAAMVTAAVVVAPATARDGGGAVRRAQAAPQFLVLPPLVRLAGRPTSRGARIRLLEVFAPLGATVTVRCRGRTCPYALRTRPVTRIRMTFKGFRRRRLAAGTIVEVLITAPNRIGKYAAFGIRRRRPPLRVDFCLQPGAISPTVCPPPG